LTLVAISVSFVCCRCCGVPFGPDPNAPSPPARRQGFQLTSLIGAGASKDGSAPCARDVGGGRLTRAGRSGRRRTRAHEDQRHPSTRAIQLSAVQRPMSYPLSRRDAAIAASSTQRGERWERTRYRPWLSRVGLSRWQRGSIQGRAEAAQTACGCGASDRRGRVSLPMTWPPPQRPSTAGCSIHSVLR